MWKCKKCGGKITASVSGTIKGGWGYPNKDGNADILSDYNLDYEVDCYDCEECGKFGTDLDEIAVWED
ncbi:hypothetical protein F350042L8_33130 [Fusobacterium ulcerans]|uniref:hypothetical protein n=1 Tax=Fusobacterium ulcerans TaxID=861 RepID=UPI0034B1B936